MLELPARVLAEWRALEDDARRRMDEELRETLGLVQPSSLRAEIYAELRDLAWKDRGEGVVDEGE